jgi:glycosyltransferase involved in cell wall biosynthesis
LSACIESILAQTEQAWELLLIDDGSTDESASIASHYAKQDRRVSLLTQSHSGQSAARNKGIEHAKGLFIAFVDADDTIAPDWLARHLSAIDGVDYVQSGHPRNKYQFTVVWNRLYRRETIDGLRFAEGMIYEDVLFSVDIWLRGASCHITDYNGYHYTDNPQSTTSRRHPEAQRKVEQALKERMRHASCRGKIIILYTLTRLKLHFIRS